MKLRSIVVTYLIMRKAILFSIIQQLLHHISRVESLIGENFTPIRGGEFPFIASFQHFPQGDNFCGGALITTKHVITSAFCLENVSPESCRILFEVAAQEPAETYTAASWTTYVDWARGQGMSYASHAYGVAIVTLTSKVYHVNPVSLNELTKRQLIGKEATMIGFENDVLSKATVNLLSFEDCDSSTRVLRNDTPAFDDRVVCSTADPFALLHTGDMGSPLLDAHGKSLLGVAFGFGPVDQLVRGNFSTEFIRQHQVNVHFSVYYYRLFIYSIIPAAPGA